MQLNLKRDTQEQIQTIFKGVSYNPTMKRIVNIVSNNSHSLVDSLLVAHTKNDNDKENNLARICEHMSKKASNSCNVKVIR